MDHLRRYSTNYLLVIIVAVAIFLRLYQLGAIPVSPDWDEVSLGYNAFSVLQTGKDEYARQLPVIIESFGDYKPALYMYLAIPTIAIFGLNVFATRLPSALLGILAVIAVYYLAIELTRNKKIGLLACLGMAISPWSLQFSRVAIESNVGDAINIFVVLFFLKGLKKPVYLYISALCAGLNIYTYQSEKAFTPLIVLLLILIYWKQLFAYPKKLLVAVFFFGILLLIPTISFTIANPQALTRLQTTNFLSDSFHLLQTNVSEQVRDHQRHDLLGEVIDNRRLVYLNTMLHNYFSHFDLNWLFITGDFTDRHQAPQMGHIYLWSLPFLLIGFYSLFFGNFERKTKLLIFGWLFLAPVPAAITNDVPHAVRTLNFLPTFQLFIAIGCVTFYSWISHRYTPLIQKTIFAIVILIFCGNFLFYLDHYFVQYNYFSSQDWQYGYTQLIPYIEQNQSKYSEIVISNKVPLDESYMFFLFYLQYPPQLTQSVEGKTGHFTQDHAFGKYEFRDIDSQELANARQGVLYVVGEYTYTGSSRVIKRISFLNGMPDMKLVVENR